MRLNRKQLTKASALRLSSRTCGGRPLGGGVAYKRPVARLLSVIIVSTQKRRRLWGEHCAYDSPKIQPDERPGEWRLDPTHDLLSRWLWPRTPEEDIRHR